jgi:hypothetical protein
MHALRVFLGTSFGGIYTSEPISCKKYCCVDAFRVFPDFSLEAIAFIAATMHFIYSRLYYWLELTPFS